jgi:hypothetical protein
MPRKAATETGSTAAETGPRRSAPAYWLFKLEL